MASSKNYLQFVLEQLSELDEITYRTMMGEFIIYYRGKIVGGIYDDRLLVKPTKSAIAYMTDPVYEVPMSGQKQLLQRRLTVWKLRQNISLRRFRMFLILWKQPLVTARKW